MPIKLPMPIDAYFKADRNNSDAVGECFTKNAIVKDENQTYSGLAAIKQWNKDATNKYTFSIEPFAVEEDKGKTIVTSQVTGNFPGSPVDLRYYFNIDKNKIAFLEIVP
jgi:hypothetical protein